MNVKGRLLWINRKDSILKSIYDEFIISDIEDKIGAFDNDDIDEIINRVIKYVERHYDIDYQNNKLTPRNF